MLAPPAIVITVGLLAKTFVWIELPAHCLGILDDIDDAAIITHLETIQRPITGEHGMVFQLFLHLAYDRGRRKRFTAGYAGKWRITVECACTVARLRLQQQARRETDRILGTGLHAGAALQAATLDKKNLRYFAIRAILQRPARAGADTGHAQGTFFGIDNRFAKRRLDR